MLLKMCNDTENVCLCNLFYNLITRYTHSLTHTHTHTHTHIRTHMYIYLYLYILHLSMYIVGLCRNMYIGLNAYLNTKII